MLKYKFLQNKTIFNLLFVSKFHDMEEYMLYTGTIDGLYREVRIFPVVSSPNQYLIHWDGYEVGRIMKVGDKWYTSSVALVNVINELGVHIDQQKFGEDQTLMIEGRRFTVTPADEAGRYYIEWDGVRLGYVTSTVADNGIRNWSGSIPLLNYHAQTIGYYIIENNL